MTNRKGRGPDGRSRYEHLRASLAKNDPSACWLWDGRIATTGYGVVEVAGKRAPQFVHRLAYQLAIGPIPGHLDLDHLCRNRACFNPRHLEPVTRRTNLLRGAHPSMRAYVSDMCQRGLHPLSDGNVATRVKNGRVSRWCRACQAEYKKAHPLTDAQYARKLEWMREYHQRRKLASRHA